MQVFQAAAKSDQGRERETNEDRVICQVDRGILAVIDGVGGHLAGQIAANIARERLLVVLSKTVAEAESRLREAITLANNAIYDEAEQQQSLRGMACVVTVALIEGRQLTVGHVGDTRLYKVRGGRIRQVTRDHSPIGEREADGRLSEREAMRHPRRSEIYRDVGSEHHDTEDEEFIDVYRQPFEPDCALVLCSDGLTDLVTSQRILSAVEDNAGAPEVSVEELIAEANKRGGKDNVSVVVAEGSAFANAVYTAPRTPKSPLENGAAKARSNGSRWRRRSPSRRHRFARSTRMFLTLAILLGLVAGFGLLAREVRQLADLLTPRPESTKIVVGAGESISAALARARPGQTIEVGEGEYREQVRLRDGVALVSRRPRGAVLRVPVEGSRGDPGVAVTADGVRGARLAGFLIAGGEEEPLRIGVRLTSSEVVVEDVEISGASEVAIAISGVDRSLLRFSYLHDNGIGIRARAPAAARIIQNLIRDNVLHGVALEANASPILIENRLVDNGTAAISAGTDAGKAEYLGWNHFGDTARDDRFRVVPEAARE